MEIQTEIHQLVERLAHGEYDGLHGGRTKILDNLMGIDRELLITTLTKYFQFADENVQCEIATILVKLEPDKYLSYALHLLSHKTPNVRFGMCMLLLEAYRQRTNSSVSLALANVVRADPDVEVRFAAANALEIAGDASAISALEYAKAVDKQKTEDGWTVSSIAASAIKAIKKRESGNRPSSKSRR